MKLQLFSWRATHCLSPATWSNFQASLGPLLLILARHRTWWLGGLDFALPPTSTLPCRRLWSSQGSGQCSVVVLLQVALALALPFLWGEWEEVTLTVALRRPRPWHHLPGIPHWFACCFRPFPIASARPSCFLVFPVLHFGWLPALHSKTVGNKNLPFPRVFFCWHIAHTAFIRHIRHITDTSDT